MDHDFSNMHSKAQFNRKPDSSPKKNQEIIMERRAESMYVPKRVKDKEHDSNKKLGKKKNQ
jgi:hypothetical protein